jgi:MFS family permease
MAPGHRVTTVGIVGVVLLVAFDGMAVATALPTAVADLHGLPWYAWSFTAAIVPAVLGMVAAGELTDRIGVRRPLLAAVGAFLTGLVVAGLAGGMAVFLLGRALQGAGGGVLVVVMYVLVGEAYPDRLRPRVFGVISAAWLLPAVVGPVFAGTLAASVGWRWVFLGLVPLLLAGTAPLVPLGRRLRPPTDPPPLRPARWGGAVLAATGVATVQWAGQDASWPRAPVAAAGLALLVAGLRVLLPPGTLRLRAGIPAVVAFRGMLSGAFFSVQSLVPLTLTLVHGMSATAAGLPLTASSLGWASAAWWQGRHPEIPRHRLLRAGFALVAVTAAGIALVAQPWAPRWAVYPVWMLGGLGMGLAVASVGVLLLALTPPEQRGVNTSALQISDAVSSAVCIGLAGALVAASTREALSLPAAVALLGGSMAALSLTGTVLAARARAVT